MTTILEVSDLWSGYGHVTVLRGVSLRLEEGDTAALFGHNGAGKSTLLRAVFGLAPIWRGTVAVRGVEVAQLPTYRRIQAQLAYVPQGEGVFRDLSVEENLRASLLAFSAKDRSDVGWIYDDFPVLAHMRTRKAGMLSGGERRLLAIAMALVRRPRVVLLDEPSIGISPGRIVEIFQILSRLQREEGLSMIVAEQNVLVALNWLTRALVIKSGSIHWQGLCSELQAAGEVHVASLL
jgi:branched-chain amino acid transport system ATP-binding protein